jgi:hypothetical protein
MASAMNRLSACLICVAPALLLGACAATPGEFPSLAKRPSERVSGTLQPAPAPVPPQPIDPATARQLDSLLGRVRATDLRFGNALAGVRALVQSGAGASKGSEAWSIGTAALASLEGIRGEAMIALADIDAIYAAGRIEGEPAAEAKTARAAAMAIVLEQDRIIVDLQARLAN